MNMSTPVAVGLPSRGPSTSGALEYTLVPHAAKRLQTGVGEVLLEAESAAVFALDALDVALLDALDAAPATLASLLQAVPRGPIARAGGAAPDENLEIRVGDRLRALARAGVIRGPAAPATRIDAGATTDLVQLHTLVLNVGTGCNLACGYCYKSDLTEPASTRAMSIETARAAVDSLLAANPARRSFNVVFFGGEPLLQRPLIEATVDYAEAEAARRGVQANFALTTNATLLTPRIIDWLNAHRFGITVSIDGPASLHDRFRRTVRGRGSYRMVARGVERLLSRYTARPVGARVTLASGAADVPAIWQHLHDELGFAEVGFSPVTGGPDTPGVLTDTELDGVFTSLCALSESYVAAALDGRALGLANLHQTLTDLWLGRPRQLPCGAGAALLAVDHAGDLHLCHRFTGSDFPTFGNVRTGADKGALNSFLARRGLRDANPCSRCHIRALCAGGCYHEAFSRYDDPTRPVLHYCDRLRAWTDHVVDVFVRIQSGRPGFFAEQLAGRLPQPEAL